MKTSSSVFFNSKMFISIVVALMAFILNSFTYIASFTIDIDPMVKEIEKRNARDLFALECIESTSLVFMRHPEVFESGIENLIIPSADQKTFCEISFKGSGQFQLVIKDSDSKFLYSVNYMFNSSNEVERILISN